MKKILTLEPKALNGPLSASRVGWDMLNLWPQVPETKLRCSAE